MAFRGWTDRAMLHRYVHCWSVSQRNAARLVSGTAGVIGQVIGQSSRNGQSDSTSEEGAHVRAV